jgi:hypothetical protein
LELVLYIVYPWLTNHHRDRAQRESILGGPVSWHGDSQDSTNTWSSTHFIFASVN